MSETAYCPVCRRVVPSDRSTCPACGADLCRRYEFEDLLAEPFEILEIKANEQILNRIDRMEWTLSEMERELDSFLVGASRKALPRPV